jgi:hypothetical protein
MCKIGVRSYLKGCYGNNPPCGVRKNKANFKTNATPKGVEQRAQKDKKAKSNSRT